MNKRLIATAGYVRVSHDEQVKNGFSLEAQKKGLEKYAREKGFKIVEWYVDEGKTARKNQSKRKAFLKLLEDAKQGKFEMIIFKCLDRWFRNISEYYKAQSILDDNGVNWECSEEDYDTTTRDGRWKLHIYLMLAQDEADKGSERIHYVFENKVKNKEAITGSQPYGFMVKEIDGFKRVVKDESVEDIVHEVFHHFSLYHSKRFTLHHVQDKFDAPLTYGTITKILTNPYYYGMYKGVENYIWDEPYITKEQFNVNQLAIKKNVPERKNSIDYIFSGLLVCSECGGKLTGSYTIKTINSKGEQRMYKQYRCCKAYVNDRCSVRGTYSEIKLEEGLINSIESEIEKYIVNYELELKTKPKPKIDTKEIKEEMDRLNKMYQKKRIEEKDYDYEYDRLEKKLENALKETPKKRDLTPLYEFLNSGWKNIYDTLEMTEKRALWRSVIDTISVDSRRYKKNFTINFL